MCEDPLRDEGSGVGPAGAIRVGKYKLIIGNPGICRFILV